MFQIVNQTIADVTFADGTRFDYRITPEQLSDAEAKMAEGAGILRWQPDFGSRTDPLEILAVKHLARLRHYVHQDTTNALVQLWYRRDDGRLYLGDPDDSRHLYRLDNLTDDQTHDQGRTFRDEAGELIRGDMDLADLGAATVGRPNPIDADMVLAAEGHATGARLTTVPSELGNLDDGGRAYLAGLLPESMRPPIPQRQRTALTDWPASEVRA